MAWAGQLWATAASPSQDMSSRLLSFDHLVGAGDERRRHGKSERVGGLVVDHQLETGRQLDGQIGRLGAAEDFAPLEMTTGR
jgi:hypothetical protein